MSYLGLTPRRAFRASERCRLLAGAPDAGLAERSSFRSEPFTTFHLGDNS